MILVLLLIEMQLSTNTHTHDNYMKLYNLERMNEPLIELRRCVVLQFYVQSAI
jgi:hypothetical protein